jgi:nitroimidazol reductase NimA-like FMN-containing flavoprotein (pyridoxamine 5'-phosphate oxidase superfamily)
MQIGTSYRIRYKRKDMGSTEEYTKIRRDDRSQDESWIKSFLARAEFGTLATARDDQPFLVTRNFAYDANAHAIYMHGAQKGRTHESARNSPRVCFSASEAGRLLPAKRAMNLGTEFGGVVVFGRLHLVNEVNEGRHGLQLLCDKYFPHLEPGVDYETTTDVDLKVTAVLRIDIESWSGKEKKVAQDFPGAFYFRDVID